MQTERIVNFLKENLPILISLAVTIIVSVFLPDYYGLLWNYLMKLGFSSIILMFIILIITIVLTIFVLYLVFFIFDYSFQNKLEKIKEKPLIAMSTKNKFFSRENKTEIYTKFTISMIFEEILFRHVILGAMIYFNNFPAYDLLTIDYLRDNFLWILISSLIFAAYHIHFYITTKQKEFTAFFVVSSFILGLLAGFIFLYYGTIIAIVFHWSAAYFTYQLIAKHLNLKDNKNDARISDISKIRKI